MGVTLDFEHEGIPVNDKYPVLDLARDKVIDAIGWEQITLTGDEAGNVITVSLRQ
jgi:hypothetical protein